MRHAILLPTLAASLLLAPLGWIHADDPDVPYEPKVEGASDEGQKAIAGFRVPEGFQVRLFAAEPLLANPVAFAVDGQNRFYVAETFRHTTAVTDNRSHMNWLDADLAARTVEDRVAMYRKFLTPEQFDVFGVDHDRVRLVEDRDGDGVADHAEVFADGFKDPAAGIGAGLLARGKDVWFTCIPNLYLLRDDNGDGKADEQKILSKGYGVHVAFLGHDLHGLIFGPDGRIYFSIGDRAINAEAIDGSKAVELDSGSILRCEPDGSKLEILATGLRNPQELAFDDLGNLFTVDNNSDSGDRARFVHVAEGGDSGWRVGYQYIEKPNSRGPWNAEKLWYPEPENTGLYLIPPIANVSDGPSGFTYDPGTGLPDRLRHHFFLADFRGSPGNSGVRSFAVEPNGATFRMVDSQQFLWGLEATDVDFGTDGALYVSDWVEGWNKTGKGRIYRVLDPAVDNQPIVAEVKTLLAEGMSSRETDSLVKLLSHPDRRVRQSAQFELADRAKNAPAVLDSLRQLASHGSDMFTRLHALRALGQVGRTRGGILETLAASLDDSDAGVQAQAARLVRDIQLDGESERNQAAEALRPLLASASAPVQFEAALSLGRVGTLATEKEDASALVALIERNADHDAYLRHAAVMALSERFDARRLSEEFGKSENASVRLAALLALRRQRASQTANFVHDSDPRIVLEAARAINDLPIPEALPALAGLQVADDAAQPLLRRIVNANVRVGGTDSAQRLAQLAARGGLPDSIRVEALDALANWSSPPGLDRVTGLWRPIEPRQTDAIVPAVAATLARLAAEAPADVRQSAIHASAELGLRDALPALREVVSNRDMSADLRIEALKALGRMEDAELSKSIHAALDSGDGRLRSEAVRLLASTHPAEAIPLLKETLESGSTVEKQGAFATLGTLDTPTADELLASWLDRLNAGQVAPEVQLDLLEAVEQRSSPALKTALERYQESLPKDDPLAPYRVALVGGDARRGGRVFFQKAEVSCLRCHKVFGNGGEVGPELTGIGAEKTREYLLESIVQPSKAIAEGFETVVVGTSDGQVLAGVLKGEDDQTLRLMTPEAKLLTIPKDQIDERSRGASAMPEDLIQKLTRSELRDLVEFLASSQRRLRRPL